MPPAVVDTTGEARPALRDETTGDDEYARDRPALLIAVGDTTPSGLSSRPSMVVELFDGVEIPMSPFVFIARWATSFVGVDDFVFLRKPMICVLYSYSALQLQRGDLLSMYCSSNCLLLSSAATRRSLQETDVFSGMQYAILSLETLRIFLLFFAHATRYRYF